MWRRHRQAAALRTQRGDERAEHDLACITARTDEQTTIRHDNMLSRSGASARAKLRCQQVCNAQLNVDWSSGQAEAAAGRALPAASWAAPPLGPETMQCATAEGLAARWNACLHRYARRSEAPPTGVGTCG